jgi:hypothetical protein
MKGIFNSPEVIYFKSERRNFLKHKDEAKIKLMKKLVRMWAL